MKISLIFIIVLIVRISLELNENSLPLSIAFEDVANEIFVKLNQSFEVILYGSPSSYALEAIDQFLQTSNCIVNLKRVQDTYDWDHQIWQSAIFVIGTTEEAEVLYLNFEIPYKVPPKKLRFLIYIEELKDYRFLYNFERPRINGYLHISHFSYYVIETNKAIEIFTIDPFREGHCSNYNYVKIATLSKQNLTWKNGLKIEEKFINFHGCIIVFAIESSREVLASTWKIFFDAISEVGNFTVYIQFEIASLNYKIYKDRKQFKTNLGFATASLHANFYESYHVTTTFGNIAHIFVLTPSEKFTSYEKMFMPFDGETWTYLGVTFGMAFVTIWILRFTHNKTRHSVIGYKVQHPGFNVIGAFFGVSQTKSPKENSARIILIFFLFFCLVFRTAYQGVLFELITSDIRKKLPTTIQELYDKNYTIFLHNFEETMDLQLIKEMIPFERRPDIFYLPKNLERFYLSVYNSSMLADTEKYAFYMTDIQRQELANILQLPGTQLEEVLYSTSLGFGVPKNCFLFHIIDKVVQDLISTGIMSNIYNQYMDYRYFAPPQKEPKVLTVDDLEFGFVLWLIAALVSFVMFLSEFFLFKFLRKVKFCIIAKVKNLVGKILVLRGLKNLYFD